jgi:predicted DNA-binding transcriptional regulator AlpA
VISQPINGTIKQTSIAESSIAHWPLAVDAETASRLFGLSVRAWWRLHSSGRCPLPIRIGRACRWRIDELRRWAEAGAPPREAWQLIREHDGESGATMAPLRAP